MFLNLMQYFPCLKVPFHLAKPRTVQYAVNMDWTVSTITMGSN